MERTRSAADPTTRQMSCCRFVADLLSIPLDVPARCEVRVARKPPPSWTDRYAGARFPRRGIDYTGVVDSVVDSARFPEARILTVPAVSGHGHLTQPREIPGSARGAATRYQGRDVSARPVAVRCAFSKTPYAHANPRRSEHRCARWRRPPTCTDPLAEMDVLARVRIGSRVIDFALATTRSEPAAALAHRNLTRTTARPARAGGR
jgi:hypothetical protein